MDHIVIIEGRPSALAVAGRGWAWLAVAGPILMIWNLMIEDPGTDLCPYKAGDSGKTPLFGYEVQGERFECRSRVFSAKVVEMSTLITQPLSIVMS